MNWPRVIGAAFVLAVMLAGLWATEHRKRDNLPLVHAALQFPKPLLLAPCGPQPGNLSKWRSRDA